LQVDESTSQPLDWRPELLENGFYAALQKKSQTVPQRIERREIGHPHRYARRPIFQDITLESVFSNCPLLDDKWMTLG